MTRSGADPADLLAEAAAILARAGVENARHDAELLLAHASGRSRAALIAGREPVGGDARDRFRALVERRAARVPLQHLLGRWPFLELDLAVDRRALIPRPETEDLALVARRLLPAGRPALAADVGTGSGCLALALAHAHPAVRLAAIDVDRQALALAAVNLRATGLGGRVALLRGDLMAPLSPAARFDLVVANLPYVAPEEIAGLAPEVREHEPLRALVAERGGLALIERLLPQAAARLRPGGAVALEVAPAQAGCVAARLEAAGFARPVIQKDRFGRARIVTAVRPAA